MDLKEKNVKSIFDEIGFMNNKRLGRCFQTRRKKYYFDTGTGKVFEVNSNVYYILQKILDNADKEDLLNDSDVTVEALNEVYSSIMQENILKAPVLEGFIGSQITDLEGQLTKHRAQITLELTERCNLRCKYCIYNEGQGGYRNFGNRDMTYEIAKQGIDDLIENSGDYSIYVGFYGGEPLLKFDLMKRCIDYCETISGKDITYAITTNGTLMTNEIAQYFAKLGRKIHITLSLDGPQAINDKYRVYKNGKGTFSDVLKGLKNLLEAFKDKDTLSLGINTVLSEPTTDNLDKIETFFEELPGLPDNVIYTSSFVATKDKAMDYLGVDSEVEREIFFNSNHINDYFDPLFTWATSEIAGKDVTEKRIAHENIVKELALIHKRLLFDKPMPYYYLNGCCVPGARRVYVTTTGDYLLCEKMGPSPTIGNVYTGLDISRIKEFYVDKFCDEAKRYCKDCWAVHLCGMCYMNCFEEENVNFKYRHSKCIMNRLYIQKNLELYHEILENNPQVLQVVDKYDFV